MNKALKDFIDRVGSTAVQAFVGVMTAAQITGLGDIRSAAIAAGSAALVAVVKVIGVQASTAGNALQANPDEAVDAIAKGIAAKLAKK